MYIFWSLTVNLYVCACVYVCMCVCFPVSVRAYVICVHLWYVCLIRVHTCMVSSGKRYVPGHFFGDISSRMRSSQVAVTYSLENNSMLRGVNCKLSVPIAIRCYQVIFFYQTSVTRFASLGGDMSHCLRCKPRGRSATLFAASAERAICEAFWFISLSAAFCGIFWGYNFFVVKRHLQFLK